MDFLLSRELLAKAHAAENFEGALFYQEKEALSGVTKIAAKVMHDIELVFGVAPKATFDKEKLAKHAVIYGTLGAHRF